MKRQATLFFVPKLVKKKDVVLVTVIFIPLYRNMKTSKKVHYLSKFLTKEKRTRRPTPSVSSSLIILFLQIGHRSSTKILEQMQVIQNS
jgi:hypothetical protein